MSERAVKAPSQRVSARGPPIRSGFLSAFHFLSSFHFLAGVRTYKCSSRYWLFAAKVGLGRIRISESAFWCAQPSPQKHAQIECPALEARAFGQGKRVSDIERKE
jgi:hypothetical protein